MNERNHNQINVRLDSINSGTVEKIVTDQIPGRHKIPKDIRKFAVIKAKSPSAGVFRALVWPRSQCGLAFYRGRTGEDGTVALVKCEPFKIDVPGTRVAFLLPNRGDRIEVIIELSDVRPAKSEPVTTEPAPITSEPEEIKDDSWFWE